MELKSSGRNGLRSPKERPAAKASAILVPLFAAMSALAQPAAEVSFEHVTVDADGPRNPWLKTIGDLNGDGRTDLIAGGNDGGGLVWYENPTWRKHAISAGGDFSTDGEAADVDGDGDQDLVVVAQGELVWLENPAAESRPAGSGIPSTASYCTTWKCPTSTATAGPMR